MRDYDVVCSNILLQFKNCIFSIKVSSAPVARSRILLKIGALYINDYTALYLPSSI